MPFKLGLWEIGLIVLILIIIGLLILAVFLIIRAINRYIKRHRNGRKEL